MGGAGAGGKEGDVNRTIQIRDTQIGQFFSLDALWGSIYNRDMLDLKIFLLTFFGGCV